MKERPILFSDEMVRALLDGRKTQTRRILKEQPPEGCGAIEGPAMFAPTVFVRGAEHPGAEVFGAFSEDGEWSIKCPYGQPGDRLWVRETTIRVEEHGYVGPIYRASENGAAILDHGLAPAPGDAVEVEPYELRLRPSIHMPRSMARLLLEVTAVRVQRLQDIGDSDAAMEGVEEQGYDWIDYLHRDEAHVALSARASFSTLWDSINGRGSWNANPWVWVVEFQRVDSEVPL
ncbi:hypothetical protein ACJ7V3_11685 [Halomonas elongata]|uniref:hypothetical protein n=1 Tax=Halomonas elongata TaxID=2746 RepID=UPI0038D443C0